MVTLVSRSFSATGFGRGGGLGGPLVALNPAGERDDLWNEVCPKPTSHPSFPCQEMDLWDRAYTLASFSCKEMDLWDRACTVAASLPRYSDSPDTLMKQCHGSGGNATPPPSASTARKSAACAGVAAEWPFEASASMVYSMSRGGSARKAPRKDKTAAAWAAEWPMEHDSVPPQYEAPAWPTPRASFLFPGVPESAEAPTASGATGSSWLQHLKQTQSARTAEWPPVQEEADMPRKAPKKKTQKWQPTDC